MSSVFPGWLLTSGTGFMLPRGGQCFGGASQCVRYLLCGLFPAAQGRPPLPGGGPESAPVALVVQPVAERGGEGSRIVRRDQLARAGAVGRGAERFWQPADVGRDDRQAVGERFGDGHAVGLRTG